MVKSYLDAATRCQSQIYDISDPDSLSSRYCVVLEELKLEAIKRCTLMVSSPVIDEQTSTTDLTSTEDHAAATRSLDDHGTSTLSIPDFGNEAAVNFDVSPQSSVADMASWIDFESMVSEASFVCDAC